MKPTLAHASQGSSLPASVIFVDARAAEVRADAPGLPQRPRQGEMRMTKDYPLQECAEAAAKYIEHGGTVFQKFTCEKCGQRLRIDEPNKFFPSGSCDFCGHVTNIEKRGCNYVLIKAL